MRNLLVRPCYLLPVIALLAGCSGRPQTSKSPPPAPQTPPIEAAQPAPPPTGPAATPQASQSTTSTAKQVAPSPTPQPSSPTKVTPPPTLRTPPAPKLTLTTSAEKSLGIPIYPGAKAETAAPQANAGDFAQRLVLTTKDSMEKVEIYYTKTFPGAIVAGRGKVGDQPFENILLVSGPGERRAFFYQPSGKDYVKIELTVGR